MNPRMNLSPHNAAMIPTLITNTISIGNPIPPHIAKPLARTTPMMTRKMMVTRLTDCRPAPSVCFPTVSATRGLL